MTRRKRTLLAAGLLIVLTLAGWLLIPPSPGITRANGFRLRYGMTLEEVQDILGEPGRLLGDPHHPSPLFVWKGQFPTGDIYGEFTEAGTLDFATMTGDERLELLVCEDDSFFFRLRRQLGLWSPPRKNVQPPD